MARGSIGLDDRLNDYIVANHPAEHAVNRADCHMQRARFGMLARDHSLTSVLQSSDASVTTGSPIHHIFITAVPPEGVARTSAGLRTCDPP